MAAPAATRPPHPPQHPPAEPATPAEHSLKPQLASRHLTMLALGGVIGAGLFVGSGQGLALAGPAVLVSYLVAALIALAIMRMLGELAAALPVSGSFSVYADKALGPWAGFTTGWLYWWITSIAIAVEAMAAAGIVHQWIPGLPNWVAALAFMALFTGLNTLSVKMFGEAEFWFASLKVAAVIAFIALGAAALFGWLPGTPSPGTAHLTGHGGFAPHGTGGILAALLAVIFAFGGMEVIAMAAAESADPALAVSRAVRSAIWRIALFYIGSVAVLAALLPWTAAEPGRSPYPLVLERLGIPAAGTVTEAVILVALLSALNANLYGTSRMLHSLALRRDAPATLAPVSSKGAPRRAVLASAALGFLCIPLEAVRPGAVLPVLAEAMGGAMLFMWLTVAASHLVLRRRLERTEPERLVLRTPGFPGITLAVIVVLVAVIAAMALDPSARGQILGSGLLAGALAAVGHLRRRTA